MEEIKNGINEDSIQDTDSAVTESKKLSIVYAVTKLIDDGFMLRHSIRSVMKHLIVDDYFEDPNVVVICPEKPSWLPSDNYIKSNPYDEIRLYDLECLSKYFQDNEKLTDNFILMNDRMFFISDVMMADIQVLKSRENLNANDNTLSLLTEECKSSHDYDNMMPSFFVTSLLKKLLADVRDDIDIKKMSIRSLYYNMLYDKVIPVALNWRDDNWLLPIANSVPNRVIIDEQMKKSRFMFVHDDAIGTNVNDILNSLYEEKSPYECAGEE